MTTTEFTMEDAIRIQSEQLVEWAKVLKPEAYIMLLQHAIKSNSKCKNPYEVFRGVDIENYIHNHIMTQL